MKKILLILLLYCPVFAQTHIFPALDTNNNWTGTNTFSGSTSMGTVTINNLTVSSGITIPAFSPSTPGGASAGTAALPFSDVFIGTVANQAFHFSGSPSAMRVISLPDAASNTVQPSTCGGSTFVTAIGSNGVLSCNSASIAGLSGTLSLAQTPMTTRGDLMGAVGGANLQRIVLGANNRYLKSNGLDTVYSTLAAGGIGTCGASTFVTSLNADAAPTCAQPQFADVNGTITIAQLPSVQGNGSKVQLATTGGTVLNDCAKFDANGNVVDAGTACVGQGPSNTSTSLTLGNVNVPVTGLKVISTATVIGLGSGDVDIYTVPAGKKALVVDCTFTNPTGSGVTITAMAEYKISGVYTKYDFLGNSIAPGVLGTLALLTPMLFNSGETFAINSTLAGLSVWPFILEFDNSATINVIRNNALTAGDNTILTLASNGIQLAANIEGVGAGSPLKGTLWYFNNSGIARTVGWNVVPQGGSPANSNQITAGNSVSSPQVLVKNFYGGLKTGDFFSVNTDSSSSGQVAWIIYQNLP